MQLWYYATMQLRQKLFIVLSLMAMVPLLFLLFEVLGRTERDLENRASAELYKTLDKMAQELNTLMNNQKSIVQGLAKVPIVRSFASLIETGGSQEYENKANQLAAFFLNYQSTVPSIQAIRFTDTTGKTLVKIKEGHLVPLSKRDARGRAYVEDIAYKPFFQWALKTRDGISISDFERGKVAGEVNFCPAMVRYSVPIRDELDTLQGVLIVNMWGRRVDHTVEAALGGYPGKVYIVEQSSDRQRDGVYLYHKNADYRFGNQLKTDYRFYRIAGAGLWERIRKGPDKGMVEGADGAMYYYNKYAPYRDRDTRWVLMIEADRSTVLAPVIKLRSWIGFLIAVMLVISLLIARWVASRLAMPVHELAQIITRYADGDKAARYQGERTDEIGLAGKAFNYLTRKLEIAEKERDKAESAMRQSERLAAIGQMAAGIGHEINNPLMNIMSLTSLIQQSLPKDDKQLHEDIEAIQNEGRRCARIVQGILNFARETPPEYRHFDMSQLINETLLLLRHRFETAGIELKNECQESLPMEGDTGQLQQVLVNVLLNALQASPSGSTIHISSRQCDQSVCISISDEGEGVREEDIERVFHPFFSTKAEGKGTGLGLSVSYGIIRKHGGTITLQNREQGGVKVSIVMPLHEQKQKDNHDNQEEIRDAVNQS